MAKIGRNDPCWCESGKKFKKCHGANDATDAPHFDPDEGLQADARSLTKALLQESSARPGCHHGEAFRRLEKVAGPGAIDAYAQHVLGRSYSESELARARTIVRTMAEQVVTHAGPADLTGLCKDVANTVIGVLEREGIWCFGVAGSVQFVFSPDTHLDDRYFWVRDEGEPGSFLGHAWVVAPPFGVVDCTAKHQRWENGEGAFVPAPVLAEEVEVVAPSRRLFSANGLPALVPTPDGLLAAVRR